MRALASILVALALAAPALAGDQHPTLSELETEIICPACHTTLDQSDSAIARHMKAFIQERISSGDSSSQIKAKLVSQFGPAVLASPPKKGFDLVVWLLPLAGVIAGAVVLAVLARRWSRARSTEGSGPGSEGSLAPDVERQLDEELARFDA